MTEADKRFVYGAIKEAVDGIMQYIQEDSNKHYDKGMENSTNIVDNTDAILELGSIVGEIQEAYNG